MFYFELTSKPNIEIIGNTVYIWKQNNFKTIFTSADFKNIQDSKR